MKRIVFYYELKTESKHLTCSATTCKGTSALFIFRLVASTDSTIHNAEKHKNTHTNVIAAEDGITPAGAVARGMARHPEPTAVPAKIATEARKRLNASASSSEEDGDFSPTMWLLVLRVRVFSLKEEEEMAAISTSPSF